MSRFILGLLYFFRFHFVVCCCWQLSWIRGLCISFTSCLFPVKRGVKSLGTGGSLKVWGLEDRGKNLKTGGRGVTGFFFFLRGGGRGGRQYHITWHGFLYSFSVSSLRYDTIWLIFSFIFPHILHFGEAVVLSM